MIASIWGDVGATAAIIAAVAWAVLVIILVVVMANVFRLLESVKLLVDGIRQETVPLLGEVTTTVSSVNKELERVDGMVESAGHIVKSAERISSLVEHAVSSPLIKVIGFGAGAQRAVRRLRKRK